MLKLEQQGSNSGSSAAAVVQRGKQLDPQLGDMLLDVQAGLAKAVRGAAGLEDRLQVITELDMQAAVLRESICQIPLRD